MTRNKNLSFVSGLASSRQTPRRLGGLFPKSSKNDGCCFSDAGKCVFLWGGSNTTKSFFKWRPNFHKSEPCDLPADRKWVAGCKTETLKVEHRPCQPEVSIKTPQQHLASLSIIHKRCWEHFFDEMKLVKYLSFISENGTIITFFSFSCLFFSVPQAGHFFLCHLLILLHCIYFSVDPFFLLPD